MCTRAPDSSSSNPTVMEPANVLFCGARAALLASGFFNEYGEVLPWPSYDPQASLASRFSLLRRIFQYISKEHLERSRDEFSFRGNTRGLDDSEAAAIALADRGQAAHLQAADPTEWAATFPKK